MNNSPNTELKPAPVTTESAPAPKTVCHLLSHQALARTLLETKPKWRKRALSNINIAERTVRDWRISNKIDVLNHSCVLGYAICGLDADTSKALLFESHYMMRLWIANWDLTYGISHVSDFASTFRITEHFAKASIRKIETDPLHAQRAVWIRVGLMWLAGAAIGQNIPNQTPVSTKTKLKTLEARIKDIADTSGADNRRAAILCRRLVQLCAEQNRHPIKNTI
jgi:hypothetical protein